MARTEQRQSCKHGGEIAAMWKFILVSVIACLALFRGSTELPWENWWVSHVETMYEICTHLRGCAGEIEKLKSHKMMSVLLIAIRLEV